MNRHIADRFAVTRRVRVALMSGSITVLLGWATLAPVSAQQPQTQAVANDRLITPNFKDVDLGIIVEAVASVTRKTYIIDQRVRANVTVLSNTAMSPEAFYELFLSILQVNNFAAVSTGNVVKIVPAADARSLPARDMQEFVSGTSDEMVTQVIAIKNVSAATVNQAIRPLIPQYAHMGVVTSGNLLVISDRAANVNRLMKVIQRIDQVSDDSIEIVQLENASASEIVRVVNSLGGPAAQPDAQAMAAKVVADDRSNSVLISGEKSQRMRVKALIGYLDTPLKSGGDTQVRYLYYSDAEKLAAKLKEQMTGIAAAATGAPPAGAAGAAAAQLDRSISVWPDVDNNALVITAPPKVMRQINLIVDKLDIRRKQVKVEAIIVEMSVEKSAELGFNWIVGPGKEEIGVAPLGIFNQSIGGTSIGQIAAAALAVNQGQSKTSVTDPGTGVTTTTSNANPGLASVASAIPNGASLGFGRIEPTGINFVALLRALRGDGHTNIISTPYVITLDNEEAKIEVAQEVPFVTGQYATTGAQGGALGNQVNPFQTIQRQKVGTILKITPQISESGSVMLKIDQQASSLAQGTQGAVDLITNNRTITTKVLVDNGGLIVLGGLLSDGLTEGENRVPILGSIPIIGQLFKTRNSSKKKQELMVFIHPTVLNDSEAIAIETNGKYNALRDAQMNYRKGKVTLLSGEKQPSLPPLEEKTLFVDPATAPKEKASTGETIIDARAPKTPPPTNATPAPSAPAQTAPAQTTPAPDSPKPVVQ
jgi:general secretion pathway protein D